MDKQTELELYIELEDACYEISKSVILDNNVFYAGNPFTHEQRSELRLQRLKDLSIWQKVLNYKSLQDERNTKKKNK